MATEPINIEGYRKRGEHSDGGGPDLPDMERRLANLESDMKDARGDLKVVRLDTAEIKGRLSGIPTTFQVLTFFLGAAFTIAGLVFTIARVMR